MNSSPFFRLQLLGKPSVTAEDADCVRTVAVQRRRIALLALLALADERGVSRDKILGYLWPESDIERARSRLNVGVYSLRKALGEDAVISDAEGLRLNRSLIASDVEDFETALERDDGDRAVAIYSGPFLDGFFIPGAPEFERWIERERDRIGRKYCGALEKYAAQCEREGKLDVCARWWKLRAAYDPYDSRVALELMRILDSSGNTAAALQHALLHARHLKEDFGVDPSAELMAATVRLRTRHAPVEPGPLFRSAPSSTGSPRNDTRSAGPHVVKSVTDLPQDDLASAASGITAGTINHLSNQWQQRRFAVIAGLVIVTSSVAGLGLSTQGSEQGPRISRVTRMSPAPLPHNTHVALTARREAEDLYYQGRYLTTATQNTSGFAEALALYNKAVEHDPTFAKAYAGMADAYSYMENAREARAAALKALSIDSTMAEAYNALAYVYGFYEHRWLAADSAAERATSLSPGFTLAHLRRANINAALGRADIAFASLDNARALEPESWTVLYNRGSVAAALGMSEEAIKQFEAALALAPERKELRAQLAWQYWGVGRKKEAVALLRNAGNRADLSLVSEDKAELRALIRQYETDSTSMQSCQAAAIYLELGNKDAAFDQLKRAASENRFLPLLIRSPPFAAVKDDPRYGEILAELGIR